MMKWSMSHIAHTILWFTLQNVMATSKLLVVCKKCTICVYVYNDYSRVYKLRNDKIYYNYFFNKQNALFKILIDRPTY